jgi:hypothetical protein
MIRRLALLHAFFLLAPACLCAEVKAIRVPRGGEVPEVVLEAKGVLHVTYGRGAPGNGYYVQSKDLGKTFTAPVQLNQRADTVTTGMERGPKLALGKDGVLHVVWLCYYKKGGGVWYTRSTDGGKTFEAERNLTEVKPAWDNARVAANQDGDVFVFWTGQWPDVPNEYPKSPTASPISMTRSPDNGKTFAKSELVRHDYPGRACGCCRLEAQVGTDGSLYIGFRGGFENIRDPHLLKGQKTENKFKVTRISEDKWDFG